MSVLRTNRQQLKKEAVGSSQTAWPMSARAVGHRCRFSGVPGRPRSPAATPAAGIDREPGSNRQPRPGTNASLGALVMLVFWGGLIVLIVWAVRQFTPGQRSSAEEPMEILRRRLAAGEITPEHYDVEQKPMVRTLVTCTVFAKTWRALIFQNRTHPAPPAPSNLCELEIEVLRAVRWGQWWVQLVGRPAPTQRQGVAPRQPRLERLVDLVGDRELLNQPVLHRPAVAGPRNES